MVVCTINGTTSNERSGGKVIRRLYTANRDIYLHKAPSGTMWIPGTWMWRAALCCMLLETVLHSARGRTNAVCCFAVHSLLSAISQPGGRCLEHRQAELMQTGSSHMEGIGNWAVYVYWHLNSCKLERIRNAVCLATLYHR